MNLTVQYRGPLTSCNYGCSYCPFSKRAETPAQLKRDQSSLSRFTNWLGQQSGHCWSVLFTPWGEALVRKWYREAMTTLSHLPHVRTVSVQTNLSCKLDWIRDCDRDRLAFCATFHPTEVDRGAFARKATLLHEQGVRISVGMVGVPEFFTEIAALRRELPQGIPFWLNARQPRPAPYSDEEVAFCESVDPHFRLTMRRQPSLGQPCRSGETTFVVQGDGSMRRCHFVDQSIGNIYTENWLDALSPRKCPNRHCDCVLGISQLQTLPIDRFFGDSHVTDDWHC